ncbi:PAS domain S-box protein [Alkalihalophilus sp. As8PL]|uniref:histidine kinase n=1 Tax=Alkalihalophilus sp. As8PL TaxID=3237103 RepID=A0AB39BUH0_9BACI
MVDTMWCTDRTGLKVAQAFLDDKGTFTEVDAAWDELFGFDSSQLLFHTLDEVFGEYLAQENRTLFQYLKENHNLLLILNQLEECHQHAQLHLTPLNIGERQYLLQLKVEENVNGDALRAQTKEQAGSQLYWKILNGIKDAIITIKLDGTFLFVNEKAEKMLGLAWDQLKVRDFWSFLQMDQQGLSKKVYQLLSGQERVQVEYYLEKTKCWYDVRAYRLEDQVTLYFTNSSTRKKIEHDLRESERRYKSLVEHTPETISVHDGRRLIYINPAGEKLFKANSRHDLLNKRIDSLYKANDIKRISENARLLMSGKKKLTTSLFQLQCLDGTTVDVEATSTIILFKGKPAFRTILKDVSERKRMDDLIRKSDKLSMVAQLAAGVAHEIRNPLTAIKGFLQLFQREREFNEQFLELVMEELERVEGIIYEYLTLAKPNHESTFQTLKLHPIVQKVMTLVETQSIMKNVKVDFEFEDVPTIYGSEKQLKQVFLNLLRNAIEAVEENGEITIRLLNHPENQICIQIEDNGCGIPKERIERLGEPFYSTKEKGTGLGLMVCYKIIEHHEGLLTIHSELGRGTKIDVILPEYSRTKELLRQK